MVRIIRYVVSLFSLFLLLALSVVQAKAQGQTPPANSSAGRVVNIRGTVYENEKLQPMEGATVKLLNERDSMVAGAVTKQNGQFLLHGT